MKLLTTLASVVVLAAVGVTGTWAAFWNTQTSRGDTFQAGSLDVLIDGRNNLGNPIASPYFTVTNVKPGDVATAYVEVANKGSMDTLLRLYLDNIVQSPVSFADQLQVVVTLNPQPYSPIQPGTQYGNTNYLVYSGPLSGIVGTNTPITNLDAAFNLGQPLRPAWLAVYKIEVTLPASVGNAYQGATFTGHIVVNSTQFGGQNPSSVVW